VAWFIGGARPPTAALGASRCERPSSRRGQAVVHGLLACRWLVPPLPPCPVLRRAPALAPTPGAAPTGPRASPIRTPRARDFGLPLAPTQRVFSDRQTGPDGWSFRFPPRSFRGPWSVAEKPEGATPPSLFCGHALDGPRIYHLKTPRHPTARRECLSHGAPCARAEPRSGALKNVENLQALLIIRGGGRDTGPTSGPWASPPPLTRRLRKSLPRRRPPPSLILSLRTCGPRDFGFNVGGRNPAIRARDGTPPAAVGFRGLLAVSDGFGYCPTTARPSPFAPPWVCGPATDEALNWCQRRGGWRHGPRQLVRCPRVPLRAAARRPRPPRARRWTGCLGADKRCCLSSAARRFGLRALRRRPCDPTASYLSKSF